jgi:alpha-D-xyloside xylohydrolase
MKSIFEQDGRRLVRRFGAEQLWIEPWGANSLRVRVTHRSTMETEDWALLTPADSVGSISIGERGATIRNGRIEAIVTDDGRIDFVDRHGTTLLREYVRRRDTADPPRSPLKVRGREFRPLLGGEYELTVRFEANQSEHIFGMGQYQHEFLDLKGCTLELAQRNSQASVPFAVSSLGYGFLWNNPAIGRVTFAKNVTEWHASVSRQLDYWVTAGDRPADIVEAYALATGTVPLMPEWATGLWQSKLRYQTQEELLAIAREHTRRGLPLTVIAADFFHWRKQGDWAFDPEYWPDPAAMVRELRELNIELLVSIWPTVNTSAERHTEMVRNGYLIRSERGPQIVKEYGGNNTYVDVTHPGARRYLWDAAKESYWDAGVRVFWLDEAEPEYVAYEFDFYRFFLGPDLQIGNVYPAMFAKAFFDGMSEEGQTQVLNLVRCAWAGSQRYGALVWSGDTDTTWTSFRQQLRAGLNMGLAGIPWWTTDIGGFHGGTATDPAFRELVTRWFQFATFCPVLRMHGDREPHGEPLGTDGGAAIASGGPNELWSFGDATFPILERYLGIRERLRPYVMTLMEAAHDRGTPVIRPLFYDFPQDPATWAVDDAYMFGPDLLVAPVLEAACSRRSVYLPGGTTWIDVWSGEAIEGATRIEVDTPIDRIPLFARTATLARMINDA